MILRPARLSDVGMLRDWDSRQHVIDASGDDDAFDWQTEIPRVVAWREVLIAEDCGRPVGVTQIIDPQLEETHYWGEVEPNMRAIDIWIGEEADLGRGFGTQMMQLALRRCFANAAVNAVLIDPLARNSRARQFYERLGFVFAGRRRFGNDDCAVYRLPRQLWEAYELAINE